MSEAPSSAEMFSDEAIYKRTVRGQRELLRSDSTSMTTAHRVLARVNGFTNLRSLIELSPGDAREMVQAIRQLFADEFIELVDLPSH
jgi:molybdopterin biosynthesis enzyme MoaB